MKAKIRKEKIELRNLLTWEEKTEKENALMKNLLPLLEGKKMIGIYLPKDNEADITSLLFLYSQLGVPKVRNDKEMDFYLISNVQEIEKGCFGVLEPTSNVWIDPIDLEVILVPLVAFDKQKHRIGYGKGYYDRYLANTKARTIGIGFELQKCEDFICEEHDVTLDFIVSEEKVYE